MFKFYSLLTISLFFLTGIKIAISADFIFQSCFIKSIERTTSLNKFDMQIGDRLAIRINNKDMPEKFAYLGKTSLESGESAHYIVNTNLLGSNGFHDILLIPESRMTFPKGVTSHQSMIDIRGNIDAADTCSPDTASGCLRILEDLNLLSNTKISGKVTKARLDDDVWDSLYKSISAETTYRDSQKILPLKAIFDMVIGWTPDIQNTRLIKWLKNIGLKARRSTKSTELVAHLDKGFPAYISGLVNDHRPRNSFRTINPVTGNLTSETTYIATKPASKKHPNITAHAVLAIAAVNFKDPLLKGKKILILDPYSGQMQFWPIESLEDGRSFILIEPKELPP